MKIHKKNSGLSLVELLVYVFIVSLLTGATVRLMAGTFGTLAKTRSYRTLLESGSSIMERIVYNVRNGSSFNSTGNTYGTNPGSLSVIVTDDSDVDTIYTYTKNVSTNRMQESINSGTAQDMTNSGITVTNFTVNQITAGSHLGVVITITLQDNRISPAISETFTTTALMRGSY